MICSYDWSCGEALRVARCESTMNPMAYNAGNYGLWQLNRVHAHRVGGDAELFFDPEIATATAYQIWKEQGWSPWRHCGRAIADHLW